MIRMLSHLLVDSLPCGATLCFGDFLILSRNPIGTAQESYYLKSRLVKQVYL